MLQTCSSCSSCSCLLEYSNFQGLCEERSATVPHSDIVHVPHPSRFLSSYMEALNQRLRGRPGWTGYHTPPDEPGEPGWTRTMRSNGPSIFFYLLWRQRKSRGKVGGGKLRWLKVVGWMLNWRRLLDWRRVNNSKSLYTFFESVTYDMVSI